MKSLGLFVTLLAALTLQITASRKPRVVGGFPAGEGQYPYAAAINVTTDEGRYFCGGCLVGTQHILTSAQCVYNAKIFDIHLGTTKLSGDDPTTLTVATSEYFIHPNYNSSTLDSDIAIIKLREPVTHTNYIQSVANLPVSEMGDGWAYHFIGWGQVSDSKGDLSEILQAVSLATLSQKECRLTYGDAITENMLCAAGSNNQGACIGDTGSPLIVTARFGHGVPYAIASFVSGNGCESPDPSGFTKVFPFVSWIVNNTGFILV